MRREIVMTALSVTSGLLGALVGSRLSASAGPDVLMQEALAAELNLTNYSVHWCPADGGSCMPELRKPATMTESYARWVRDSAKYAAKACEQNAATRMSTEQCESTRLVYCSTHEESEINLCYLGLAACRKSVEMSVRNNDPSRCRAYFDGKPLE
jgi:hypothetical protein